MYSKTCLIRHLCYLFHCVIQHWFLCPVDNFPTNTLSITTQHFSPSACQIWQVSLYIYIYPFYLKYQCSSYWCSTVMEMWTFNPRVSSSKWVLDDTLIHFLNQWNDHPLSMCLNIPLPGFVSGIVIEQSRAEYIYDIKICIIINFFVFLPEQQLPRNQLSH